jgi:phosphate starvation-inducible PhoH-like protein
MKKEKLSLKINTLYSPKGENQKKYVEYLNNDNNKIIVVYGPAGTGKTMFACIKAINLLKSGILNKIILTRPVVTVEEELGFLPGNIVKKMDPWTRPIFDIFSEFYSKAELDNMVYNNVIEISPLAFMRGRTFKNAFIIADEMQNSSPNQMMMLTTRIGTNSRMVITGDLKQTDKISQNGLSDFVQKINIYYENKDNETKNKTIENKNKTIENKNNIQLIEFMNKDVERSDIVKNVIEIYNYKKKVESLSSIIVQNVPVPVPNVPVPTPNVSVPTPNVPVPKKSKKVVKPPSENDAALIPKEHVSNNLPFRIIWEQ